MKTALSLIFKTGSAFDYADVNAYARNVLDGVCSLLDSSAVRCSLFLDGEMLRAMKKVAKPLALGKIKSGLREGRIEFLGGGFDDPMLPLFPEKLQQMQLQAHRKILVDLFEFEPSGYFNASEVWDMDMVDALANSGFDFTFVDEQSLQVALGRSTPVTGWYTTELRGSMMRIVPIASNLSRAIANDDIDWLKIAEPYCRDGRSPTVVLEMPDAPADVFAFFERTIDFIETNDIQTWTASFTVSHQQPDGSVSSVSSTGKNLGLPAGCNSCREILIRRPEINALHKTLLFIYKKIKMNANISDSVKNSLYDSLLPAMSPVFYRDLANGMRSPIVRLKAFRTLLRTVNAFDKELNFQGLCVDVCDFLLSGRKYIWVENPNISFLLDHLHGGVLRLLQYKPSAMNLSTSWRDDGEPSLSFLDFFAPNQDFSPEQIGQLIANREYVLDDLYDYQIKRYKEISDVYLVGEQAVSHENQKGLLHVEKNFGIHHDNPSVSLSYQVINSTFVNVQGIFGTLLEIGYRPYDEDTQYIRIDKEKIKWDMTSPFQYPAASSLLLVDRSLSCTFELNFEESTNIFLEPVYAASTSAAPNEVQGLRIFLYRNVQLASLQPLLFRIKFNLSKRTLFK